MKIRSLSAVACALWLTHCSHAPTQLEAQAPSASPASEATSASASQAPVRLAYPVAQKQDVVDDYHGTKVADPYRWLENPDSPESRQWIDAENKLTFDYLEKIPARARIKQRMTELWDYEKYGMPWREGSRYFFNRNNGLQNQSVLYTTESLGAEPRVLLDPNTLSADGTVALAGLAITQDGNLLAYGVASAGSDWKEFRVRDVRTGKDLPDVVKWVKFSNASWTKDGKGFFYSRYDEPKAGEALSGTNFYQKLYFHKLGTPQSEDTLVYERKDQKEWGFTGFTTEDGRYLIINVSRGTEQKNLVFYKDLKDPKAKVVELLKDWDAEYEYISNDGTLFWFKTDLDAPRGRVVAVDLRKPERKSWKEILPQGEETLSTVSLVNDQFIVNVMKDAHSQVRLYSREGKVKGELALPGLGTAFGLDGKRQDTETFYAYSSYTTPTTIYRYDLKTGQSQVFKTPSVKFDPSQYETTQVFYTSKDGTRVPMFLSHKKGLKLDGTNPTLLYGYGGFNAPMTPGFSVANLVWMEQGGVYAVANLRGGGEYGREWHEAGTKLRKQNVFDDFIAAAEWLIANKYTSSARLAINGRSNGGLLIGAAVTQRPDLFGVALPGVGVMDMLRFHKFTIGWAWTSDYGSSENAEEFKALYAYSPLHNLKPARYPAMLVHTADHDDRVVPGHSFKFTAAAQAAQQGEAPVLIRIETKAGHGAGKPTTKIIEEYSDLWAFSLYQMGLGGEPAVAANQSH
ncbi:prolyl oligopeptidase family protein [Vitiosangium sp. GDMCC 1.1324]|uniref:prolyl oligopeptidase family serine peptidase n=1 Tax=Vitiosangium sp. (strain GDMCC 1.1324) TaxID=2138576 RepID=UPI000D35858B|nr:prolyl oligopeptidase family serine peptidase [Vitiosangium sp. GDMCC 1.1324]PTL79327.1 S9 family peptidase [Vitiosangium sp. GDMCC 1.1324]